MKLVLPLILWAGATDIGSLLFADNLPAELPAAGQLTVTAVLAGVTFYLLRVTLPSILESHKTELANLRAEHKDREDALLQIIGEERQQSRRDRDDFLKALDTRDR